MPGLIIPSGSSAAFSVRSKACVAQLDTFFTQWFDTAYPTKGGATRPTITGPGLDGAGFNTNGCR